MSDPSGRPARTVLVVDDNEIVLNVVVLMLESARFKVLSARSGPSALRLAIQPGVRIDLLLADIDMPGMSGPALAGLLKEARPNVQLMFMSGGNHDFPLDETECGYITKPFVLDNLIEKVREVLRRARADSRQYVEASG